MPGPGDLDTSFGSGGKKTITFGGVDGANAVLVQPNGRIVVAGGGGAATSAFCVAPSWPDCSKVLEQQTAHLDADAVRRIARDNARRLFGLE